MRISNRIFKDNFKEHYILGRKSIITVVAFILIFNALGFLAPSFLEIIPLSIKEATGIASALWSSYISLLGIALAISAILLAIIQIANRKISITNLLFQRTYYIPLVYYGLTNIGILAFLQLFYAEKQYFVSEFTIIRIVVISIYSFLIFLFLAALVFYKTFKYLNFNFLVDEYLKDVLRKIRINITNHYSKKDVLSTRGKEVSREIEDAIDREDNVILEKFLSAIEKASVLNPNSPFLFALNSKIITWHISAYNKNKIDIWSTLLASWRKLREDKVNTISRSTQYYYSDIAARILKDIPSERLPEATFHYTLHLKELIQYTPLSGNRMTDIQTAYKTSAVYVRDMLEILKILCYNGELISLRKAMNQLNHVINNLEQTKSEFEYDNQFGNPIDKKKKEEYEGSVGLLRTIYDALFSLSSWYAYIQILETNAKPFNKIIFYFLMEKFVSLSSSYTLDEITDGQPFSVVDWRDWIWKLEEREDGEAYFLPSEEDIKSYGLLLTYLLYPFLQPKSINYWLQDAISAVTTDRTILNKMIDNITPEELTKRLENLQTKIAEIAEDKEQANSINLANTELSRGKINEFEDFIYKQWISSRNLYPLFKAYNAIDQNPQEKLIQVGTPRMSLQNGRMMFVEGEQHKMAHNLNWGTEVNRRVEELFADTILNSTIQFEDADDIVNVFDDALMQSEKKNIKSIVAFIPIHAVYKWQVSLINSGNYQQGKEGDNLYPFNYIGIYKNVIPIVMIHSKSWNDKIIFVSMPNAIKYQQRLDTQWKDDQLEISIQDFDDAAAKEIIQKEPDKYKNIDPKKAVEILKANMIISIQEVMKFKITDPSEILGYQIKKR